MGALPENTTVIIREVPATHWSKADQTIAERQRAVSEPVTEGNPA